MPNIIWHAVTKKESEPLLTTAVHLTGIKAAEQNDYRAMCCMGSYFLMGQAVPCMPERAFQLFEKAANANIPAAQYNLSILYRYGEGVEKDIDLADTWRMKAAQNGFKLAIEEIHKEVGIE